MKHIQHSIERLRSKLANQKQDQGQIIVSKERALKAKAKMQALKQQKVLSCCPE